jgi:hypothetical protein
MVAVITGNATANLMRAVPNEGVCAAGADACAAEVMVCLPSGAMDCLHVSQLRQSGCAAEHKGDPSSSWEPPQPQTIPQAR